MRRGRRRPTLRARRRRTRSRTQEVFAASHAGRRNAPRTQGGQTPPARREAGRAADAGGLRTPHAVGGRVADARRVGRLDAGGHALTQEAGSPRTQQVDAPRTQEARGPRTRRGDCSADGERQEGRASGPPGGAEPASQGSHGRRLIEGEPGSRHPLVARRTDRWEARGAYGRGGTGCPPLVVDVSSRRSPGRACTE